jgi:protein-tyrosine-phosphatase
LDFGPREILLAQQCGYDGAFSAVEGYAAACQANCYAMPRFPLPQTLDQVARQATGLERAIQLARSALANVRSGGGAFDFQEAPASTKSAWWLQASGLRYRSLRRVDFPRVRRLVFVCKGNICRSPHAEALARQLGLQAISAGTDAIVGAPADARAIRIGSHQGIVLTSHRSRPLHTVVLHESDLVIAMEPQHMAMFQSAASIANAQVTLMGLWCTPQITKIEDPYGQSEECFVRVFRQIATGLVALREAMITGGGNSCCAIGGSAESGEIS